MIIVNECNSEIECTVDGTSYILHANDSVELSNPSDLEVKHLTDSYVCNRKDNLRILKTLNFIDDPLKTKKDYHICVNSKFDISDCSDISKLTINHKSVFADESLQIYYEYFVLNKNDKIYLTPKSVSISNSDKIYQDFSNCYRKQIKWDCFWNVFIEPVLFESIGYIAIYLLFSFWLGIKALWIISLLVFANISIDSVVFFLKNKSDKIDRFNILLSEQNIIISCYLSRYS